MNPKNAGTLFSSMEELVFFPWYRMHNDSNLYTMREKNSFRNNCVSHTIYECYRNMLFYHSAKLYGTIHNISLLEYGIPFIRLFLLLQKSENTYPSNMRLNGVWFFFDGCNFLGLLFKMADIIQKQHDNKSRNKKNAMRFYMDTL